MSSPNPTVAFLGATGGCTLASLIHTLRAGYHCTALARTPSKLTALLLSQGLSQAKLDAQLTIHTGDALDVAAVKATLSSSPTHLVRTIITGLGGRPVLTFRPLHPLQIAGLDNPTICASAAKTLISALQEIYTTTPTLRASKPLCIFISSTGITSGPQDVPWSMRFLYHQMLALPHADKKNMESAFRDNMARSAENDRVFRNIVGIRPTLLSGGTGVEDRVGLDKIRAGTEKKPAMGYSIKRADVGEWIFTNVIANESGKWEGEMVSLTS